MFIESLLAHRPEWRVVPIVAVGAEGWHGRAMTIEAPAGSDLLRSLEIEEVADEITIRLDCCHLHMDWPPGRGNDAALPPWSDPLAMVDAILAEEIVASSGWIDGILRVGSLHEAGRRPDLMVPNLHHIRVRSWRGTHDLDERLT